MPSNKHKIAIIGTGWLGQPLALSLQQQQYHVTASCTQLEKAQRLQPLGINAVQATLGQQAQGDWQTLLQDADIAICLLPPNHGNHGDSSYELQIQLLIQQLAQYQVNKLIFISSTSVYRKDNGLIDENAALELINARQEKGQQFAMLKMKSDHAIWQVLNAEQRESYQEIKKHLRKKGHKKGHHGPRGERKGERSEG